MNPTNMLFVIALLSKILITVFCHDHFFCVLIEESVSVTISLSVFIQTGCSKKV